MRILIADDEFTNRRLIQGILSEYGTCDTVVNGNEAVEVFKLASDEDKPYDLICMDIMMPEMDGQEALKKIREYEASKNITGLDGVKVIMISILKDSKNVLSAFKSGCEGYIFKPIDKQRILDEMKKLGLI